MRSLSVASTSGRERCSTCVCTLWVCSATKSGQSREQAWRSRYRYYRYQKACQHGLPQIDWRRYNLQVLFVDNSDTVRARVAAGIFERIADWNGYGRVLLPVTAGVAVASAESSPSTVAALLGQAAQLGIRPKIFARPREAFEYADFDRHDVIVALDDAVLESIMRTAGPSADERAWYAPRVATLASFLPYCGRSAIARTGGSAVLEPGLSRMVVPVLSRVLAATTIPRPDLHKGAEEWNAMVENIVVGCAGLVQYLADAYPPDLPDWDPL